MRRSGVEASALAAVLSAVVGRTMVVGPSMVVGPRTAIVPMMSAEALPPAGRGVRAASRDVGGRTAEHGEGALELVVRYPERNQRIDPDSNFVFGSLGDGGGRLEIDGASVPVEPNGAFLAWLPVPEPERGDTALYRMLASRGADSVSLTLRILRPLRAPPAGEPSPWFDRRGLARQPVRWVAEGEPIDVELVAEEGIQLRLEAGESRFPLEAAPDGRGRVRVYRGRLDAETLRASACRVGACRAGVSELHDSQETDGLGIPVDTITLQVLAEKDGKSTTGALALPVGFLAAGHVAAVRLSEADDPVNGVTGVVVGRPTPFGPYRWRFSNGTVAALTGRLGDRVRIRVGDGLDAWVLAEDVEWSEQDVGDPARAWDGRIEATPAGVDFRLGLSRAVAAQVESTGERSLAIILHDTLGEIDRIAHGPDATGVASVSWSQLPGPTIRVDLTLDWPVWGHRIEFDTGDARAYEGPRADPGSAPANGAVLRIAIRRPPAIDPESPLRGRRIAIDPGHPGAGSFGPTGLFEGDANLAVARRLGEQLAAAGASPVLVRTDGRAVGLYERTRRARAAEAELFVSIHNNALPDGIRPFERSGTSTYYYHAHSARLAREVQRMLVAHIGLRDLGVLWGDLAVAREPWMPAVLVEGAFMMIPSQEAALRTPDFQQRYARGVMAGIESYLASIVNPGASSGVP